MKTKRYSPGEPVPYGVYFSPRPLDLRFVSAEGESLEGQDAARYRRLPTLLLLALGPLLGGLFVLAFPLAVFGALIAALAHWMAHRARARAGGRRRAQPTAASAGRGRGRPDSGS